MTTETPDPDGKLLAQKLREMADNLEANPEGHCIWRLYDGVTQPMAYPKSMIMKDGEEVAGAMIQLSERHWIWAPHDIAFRLSISLAWATTQCGAELAEKEAEADE